MADNLETSKIPELPSYDFTPDEIRRFLQEKWKLTICEVCKAENSYELVATEGSVVALPVSYVSALTTLTSRAIVTVPMLCNSCGNAKLLAATVVRDWLDVNS